ncbi:MAG TPA: hypothetical protein HPP83_06915 [Candidatus Hydrogenedentes bacterium]|nr:hypothetical protein [Candidatus Hydrogenedentota bacterium]
MQLQELLARLSRVKKSAAGYTARCPAHDDRRNRLSVGEADGKLLLHWHAGSDNAAIVAALDLGMADLFTAPTEPQKRIVAT